MTTRSPKVLWRWPRTPSNAEARTTAFHLQPTFCAYLKIFASNPGH